MAVPAKATVFAQQMDPSDLVDWEADLGATLLEAGETIASFTLVLDSSGAALGISISTATGYEAAAVNGAQSVKYWLLVSGGFQDHSAYDGVVQAAVTLSIVTNSTPPRKRQRTFVTEITNL